MPSSTTCPRSSRWPSFQETSAASCSIRKASSVPSLAKASSTAACPGRKLQRRFAMRMSEALADGDLFALATRLLDQAGLGRAQSLSRLEGGKNNQVYRVDPEAGASLVLKR